MTRSGTDNGDVVLIELARRLAAESARARRWPGSAATNSGSSCMAAERPEARLRRLRELLEARCTVVRAGAVGRGELRLHGRTR